jgi:hypothetical protein
MKRWASISLAGLILAGLLVVAQPLAHQVASADAGKQQKQEQAAAHRVVTGNYRVSGTAAGKVYQGRVSIKRVGETYVIVWVIGNDTYAGIGIAEGDTLSVSCIMQGQPCVVVYKIKAGGVLDGRWSAVPGTIEREVLTLEADKA